MRIRPVRCSGRRGTTHAILLKASSCTRRCLTSSVRPNDDADAWVRRPREQPVAAKGHTTRPTRSDNRSRFIRWVPAQTNFFLPLGFSRHICSARHRSRQPAIAVLPVIQIDHRWQLRVRNSIKKGKCRPRDAFE